MLPLVELPEMVSHYAPWFEPVFSDQEALLQFQRYLSGLLVSENKTVAGINRLVVYESRNQSSLNRLLTSNPFSERDLNRQRLALLASLAGTRLKPKGVLSVDDTLLAHYGQQFDEIAKLWDPVDERYVWAHNLVNLHLAGGKPLFRKITLPYKGEQETNYSYCRTLRVHNFGKQRLVINYRQADLSDKPVFYLSNRLYWQASGLSRIRRHRWPVEVYHQEGKAEGLDQYQVRDFQAISKHIGLVAVTYS